MQFCANSAATLLEAAKLVQDECDAVDINLGCPQRIARKGRYGAFLMDDLPLVEALVSSLAEVGARIKQWLQSMTESQMLPAPVPEMILQFLLASLATAGRQCCLVCCAQGSRGRGASSSGWACCVTAHQALAVDLQCRL